jgi:hypothetical protein
MIRIERIAADATMRAPMLAPASYILRSVLAVA